MYKGLRQFLGQLRTKLKILQYILTYFPKRKNSARVRTFKSNDSSQTFFCIPDASLLITGILKLDVMATKGYSFQEDEKTIIDIDTDIVVEKEKK